MKPIVLECSATTSVSREAVFNFFGDFTTTEIWDPNTVSTRLVSGAGGVGSKYQNKSKFNGRESELIYTVISIKPGEQIVLRGDNKWITATDSISVSAITSQDGTELTLFSYRAEFMFKSWAKVMRPFLKKSFQHLRDTAEAGILQSLANLK